MRELSDLFESLYSHFILRDVLAKVLPGLIGLASIVSFFAPRPLIHLRSHLPEPGLTTVAILYGIGFMVGMLIQYLGALAPFIHIHVWREDTRRMTVETSLSRAAQFQKAASGNQVLLRQRERFAVLKEMAANFAASLLLALLAVVRYGVFNRGGPEPHGIALGILLAAIIVALVFQNRFHAIEQRTWEERVIRLFSGNDSTQNDDAG